MSDKSDIEWTDATWSPTLGCMKVSAGCENCYAIGTAYRQEFGFKRPQYQGLTRKLPDGSTNWTGKVRAFPERLTLPLEWRSPRRIFVDSMSDLFHEDVPTQFIWAVFAVMALAPQHTFQVLTKRPQRMADVVYDMATYELSLGLEAYDLKALAPAGWYDRPLLNSVVRLPMPNVWLGVSVEDQRAADERIPLLLQTPAAVRFLSCEPLLGPVDLSRWFYNISNLPPLPGTEWLQPPTTPSGWYQINEFEQPLHWVIAGGESGAKARRMELDWARSLRDQCQAAGIAFYFKQWGGRTHAAGGRELDGRTWDEFPKPVRELAHA